jgi:hypothetical protein
MTPLRALVLGCALLIGAVLIGAAVAPRARADEPRLATAPSLSLLVSSDGDVGGGVAADVWCAIGIFRIGGFFGVGALPSDDDLRNRVMMPLALSIGLEALGELAGFSVRLRGGLWGGATQEVKLTGGGFVGGGAYFLLRLGTEAGLAVGFDVWGVLGDGQTAVFAPSVGLTWSPP